MTPCAMPSPHSRQVDRPVLANSSLGRDIAIRDVASGPRLLVCPHDRVTSKVSRRKVRHPRRGSAQACCGGSRRFVNCWEGDWVREPSNSADNLGTFGRAPHFVISNPEGNPPSPSWLGESTGVPLSIDGHVFVASLRRAPRVALGREPQPSASGRTSSEIQRDTLAFSGSRQRPSGLSEGC